MPAACANSTKTHADTRAIFQPAAGSITLNSFPSDWAINDEIVIASTYFQRGVELQHELRTIAAVSGGTITLDSTLDFDHLRASSELLIHVAHLTRNIVIRSEKTTKIDDRGHVMFMNKDVDINHVRFLDLGRTDKTVLLNDSELDANDELVPGTGTNQRARYP